MKSVSWRKCPLACHLKRERDGEMEGGRQDYLYNIAQLIHRGHLKCVTTETIKEYKK